MKHLKLPSLFIISATLLTSCATYHMTTESLLNQLAETKPETRNYRGVYPFIFPGTITGNALSRVTVLDSKENEAVLPVTPHTGVRITKKDGKRVTFYFDTLLVQDSTITGKRDHFFAMNIKPVNLNNIKKIELQK